VNILQKINRRWSAEGGYRDIFVLAFPLIISTGSWSVQHFVDRMFLTWYSPEAVAAAMPAGIMNFTITSLFLGTAGYVSTFVAQYFGAGQKDRIGPSIWQGLYISLISGVVLYSMIPLAPKIFGLIGHDRAVMEYEIEYFQIICYGSFPVVAASAMSGFFSGRGKTMVIMWINILATAINLFLDYCLIFGNFGAPSLGMRGAAIATTASAVFSFIVYAAFLFRPAYNRVYNTLSGWRFDPGLFWRLIRFGLPNGIQFFVDIAGFTFVIFFIGRLGTESLAASNIAFNINTLSFMPMIGFGIAVSILVGQNLGKGDPDAAEYSVYSGFQLTLVYMAAIALLYIIVPDIFLEPFAAKGGHPRMDEILGLSRILLRFIACYCVFDTMNIIFASAVKGAGDTRFVMYSIGALSLFGLIIPTYLVLFVFKLGLYAAWAVSTGYIVLLGATFFLRFRTGKWKSMRVIEEGPGIIPPSMTESPGAEITM